MSRQCSSTNRLWLRLEADSKATTHQQASHIPPSVSLATHSSRLHCNRLSDCPLIEVRLSTVSASPALYIHGFSFLQAVAMGKCFWRCNELFTGLLARMANVIGFHSRMIHWKGMSLCLQSFMDVVAPRLIFMMDQSCPCMLSTEQNNDITVRYFIS